MWRPTLILAVITVFAIGSSTCDSNRRVTSLSLPYLSKKPPLTSQRYRFPRGTYDPSPYIYEGDIPEAPSSVDHPVLPSSFDDDVKFNSNRRTARSIFHPEVLRLKKHRRPTKALHLLPGYKAMKPRVARDLRLPELHYEVPRLPRIGPSTFDDVKFNPYRRTARSTSILHQGKRLTKHRRPTKALHLLPGYKAMKPRVARDLRLPGPDYEVPRVPRLPLTRFPWEEEAYDRVPRF